MRQLAGGILEARELDGGPSAPTARERLAEDEVVLGLLEADVLVEDRVGDVVPAVVDERDAAQVARGRVG